LGQPRGVFLKSVEGFPPFEKEGGGLWKAENQSERGVGARKGVSLKGRGKSEIVLRGVSGTKF